MWCFHVCFVDGNVLIPLFYQIKTMINTEVDTRFFPSNEAVVDFGIEKARLQHNLKVLKTRLREVSSDEEPILKREVERREEEVTKYADMLVGGFHPYVCKRAHEIAPFLESRYGIDRQDVLSDFGTVLTKAAFNYQPTREQTTFFQFYLDKGLKWAVNHLIARAVRVKRIPYSQLDHLDAPSNSRKGETIGEGIVDNSFYGRKIIYKFIFLICRMPLQDLVIEKEKFWNWDLD